MSPMLQVFLMVGGAFLVLAVLAIVTTLILTAVIDRVMVKEMGRREKLIRKILPGKDCGECGCETCEAYANALVNRYCSSVYCAHLSEKKLEELREIVSPKRDDVDEDGNPKKRRLFRREDKFEEYEHWNS